MLALGSYSLHRVLLHFAHRAFCPLACWVRILLGQLLLRLYELLLSSFGRKTLLLIEPEVEETAH